MVDLCQGILRMSMCVTSPPMFTSTRVHSLEQKFGFIKGVDKGRIATVKDLESWRFER